MKPLKQETITSLQKYLDLAKEEDDKIEERIDYIIRRVYEEFDAEIHTWHPDGYVEGSAMLHMLDDPFIENIEVLSELPEEAGIIDNDGDEWNFNESFSLPLRWLFEDFEQELVEGKRRYVQKLDAERMAEAARLRANGAKIRKQALAKLSAREKRALDLF